MSSVLSKRRMSERAEAEVEESRTTIAALTAQKAQIEAELEAETAAITARWDQAPTDLGIEQVAPRRTDIDVQAIAVAWLPAWRIAYDDGGARTTEVAAWTVGA